LTSLGMFFKTAEVNVGFADINSAGMKFQFVSSSILPTCRYPIVNACVCAATAGSKKTQKDYKGRQLYYRH
jgi:hypothetical protein